MAIPILQDINNDDPEGEACQGMDYSVVCRYEIYKALKAIESAGVLVHKSEKNEAVPIETASFDLLKIYKFP